MATNSEHRIEEKYLIPFERKATVLTLLSRRLRPSYPHENTRFTGIDSVYFDSECLDLYKDHFLSPERRFKLRTRRYGPDGIWDQRHVMLEMKIKEGRITRKDRRRLSHTDYLALRSKGLSSLRGYRLLPVCRVLYDRHAFEDKEVRVTLDERIRCSLIRPVPDAVRARILGSSYFDIARGMAARFASSGCLLLEVKHKEPVPFWLTEAIHRLAEGEVKFSKYCFAITQGIT